MYVCVCGVGDRIERKKKEREKDWFVKLYKEIVTEITISTMCMNGWGLSIFNASALQGGILVCMIYHMFVSSNSDWQI